MLCLLLSLLLCPFLLSSLIAKGKPGLWIESPSLYPVRTDQGLCVLEGYVTYLHLKCFIFKVKMENNNNIKTFKYLGIKWDNGLKSECLAHGRPLINLHFYYYCALSFLKSPFESKISVSKIIFLHLHLLPFTFSFHGSPHPAVWTLSNPLLLKLPPPTLACLQCLNISFTVLGIKAWRSSQGD